VSKPNSDARATKNLGEFDMELPKVPPFNTDAIPLELKQRRQWVCWRYDTRDGKIIKVPVAPWKGHNGPISVTDPDNMENFNVAVDWARRLGLGIGFVFFKGAGIVGIDLDKLNQLGEEARRYIQLANSYSEYSPSGQGVHIYGYGELKRAIKKAGIEVYNDARFFTVTGNHVEGTPSTLANIQPLLDALEAKYGEKETTTVEAKPQPAGGWETYMNRLGYTLQEVREKDKVLDEYLRGGLAGKPSDSEADMGTLERLLFWGYEPNEAVAILERYRWREKLQRRDYIEGMLKKLLPLKETARPKMPQHVILQHLNFIENPDLAGRPVIVEGVVASTSICYFVPKVIRVKVKVAAEAKEDKDGEAKDEVISKRYSIRDKSPLNLQLVGVSSAAKHRVLKDYFGMEKKAQVREVGYRAVYRVRVRPPVFTLERRGEKIVDERGFEYKAYDIYVVSEKPLVFQPSTLVRVEGLPMPNPRTQQTTLLCYMVEFPEEASSFDRDKLDQLKRMFQGMSIAARLAWILDNFERFSQIVGRRNLAEAGLLAYFTPTWIRFDGETQRGWANVLFCGDTTTAKTETMRKLIRLLNAGMLITAETASTVGLTGTATQLEREGWFVDWGFLVLLDRKLLAVDGAHKLSLSNWAALAEAERTGVVSITKAAKNTAYARTRQIKIANPVNREVDKYSTKSLSGFLYPCQALPTILDKTSISRLDLAVFAGQSDVSPEEINRQMRKKPEPQLFLLAEVLKWCWSDQAQVEFTEEAVDKIHEEATELYKTFFYEDIPLCSIDMKWKLARLSAALAFLTLSTNDYSKVTVTKEHVDLVVQFIREEYSKAGLNILAQTERHEALTLEDVKALLLKIEGQLADVVDEETLCGILRYFVLRGRATRDEIKTKFGLAERNQLRPLLAILTSEGLIKASKGFYPEPKLIQAYKASDGFNLAKLANVANLRKEPSENSE